MSTPIPLRAWLDSFKPYVASLQTDNPRNAPNSPKHLTLLYSSRAKYTLPEDRDLLEIILKYPRMGVIDQVKKLTILPKTAADISWGDNRWIEDWFDMMKHYACGGAINGEYDYKRSGSLAEPGGLTYTYGRVQVPYLTGGGNQGSMDDLLDISRLLARLE